MNRIHKSEVLLYNNWILRLHTAYRPESRLMLMIHGWTGDENSMLIFQREMPDDYWIIAPRGPLETGEGGYGWIGHRPGRDATLEAFEPPAQALHRLIENLRVDYQLGNRPLDVVGFSQGAALSLTFAFLYPQVVRKVAVLAGFLPYLPENYQPSRPFSQINFFVAHGTHDDIVPIERAEEVVYFLEQQHATVQFCKAPVSHRISAGCFKQLGQFFAD